MVHLFIVLLFHYRQMCQNSAWYTETRSCSEWWTRHTQSLWFIVTQLKKKMSYILPQTQFVNLWQTLSPAGNKWNCLRHSGLQSPPGEGKGTRKCKDAWNTNTKRQLQRWAWWDCGVLSLVMPPVRSRWLLTENGKWKKNVYTFLLKQFFQDSVGNLEHSHT